jgi:hypothetical protein
MEDGEGNSMGSGFRIVVDQMEPLLQALQTVTRRLSRRPEDLPRKGIYAFYEDGRAIYGSIPVGGRIVR